MPWRGKSNECKEQDDDDEFGGASLKQAIEAGVDAAFGEVQALYRHLHQYPELPFQEHETAARLAAALEALGFEVTRGVGGTGVVALLRNGEGPTVLLRGDMDALPIEEQTGLDYASRVTAMGVDGKPVPVMHACGHDLHSSCAVGAGAVLAGLQARWRGTLMVVCQPAEEIFGGAGPCSTTAFIHASRGPTWCWASTTCRRWPVRSGISPAAPWRRPPPWA
ncbi:M20/M25/M40 family metallo-hydrolase [Halomonas sp. E19]|uniref:M20/M25/M40 family metallo-hydrolase n=1 Tax=Halomonas sp. E19 TaxID=3397247 RepID=UPI004034F6B0